MPPAGKVDLPLRDLRALPEVEGAREEFQVEQGIVQLGRDRPWNDVVAGSDLPGVGPLCNRRGFPFPEHFHSFFVKASKTL